MSMIRKRIQYCHIVFFLLSSFLCSDLRAKSAPKPSNTKRDITTPIATVPTMTNPTRPESSPSQSQPPQNVNAAADTGPSGPAGSWSWCVASQGASRASLQAGLDYACGPGSADCRPIQRGGVCFNPDTLRDHASFAFNAYFHNNPLPNSCNFGGTAVTTSTNPSTTTCQYPSTSTSSSVLNTTNSRGSTVFGAVPSRPTPPSSEAFKSNILFQRLFTFTCLMFFSIAK